MCGGPGLPEGEPSYLLLDRDRRLLDEGDDAREDAGLLRAEILHMQETEVQAFRDESARLRARAKEARELRRRLDRIEGSRAYRLYAAYRRLLSRLRSRVRSRPTPGKPGRTDGG